ncbi:acyl-CoA dehydrogenase family protein, partial [Gulosibacter sediminis]|uniref:acyl-CoA dehydrogenase family protein n=1 Tax=Gulosibacter sediminis TaxID=1729695 RepID=UPI0024AD12A0
MNSETGSVVPAPHVGGRSILAPATAEFANLVERLVASAEQCRGEPQAMLATLSEEAIAPEDFPLPGEHTLALWELLAEVAATDLVAARTLEPHLDALAITAQSPEPVPAKGTWGVYAAEGGDSPLTAHHHLGSAADVHLNGVKPWCSLAGSLDAALVTAHTDGGRQLFAIDLHHPGVQVERVRWVSRGLAYVPSGPVRFDNVPATAVGAVGWYFDRPGFAWGGAGVAACWFGGAVGVYRDLVSAAAPRPPAQIGLALQGGGARVG